METHVSGATVSKAALFAQLRLAQFFVCPCNATFLIVLCIAAIQGPSWLAKATPFPTLKFPSRNSHPRLLFHRPLPFHCLPRFCISIGKSPSPSPALSPCMSDPTNGISCLTARGNLFDDQGPVTNQHSTKPRTHESAESIPTGRPV